MRQGPEITDPSNPQEAVGQAIQRLTAARLGRGFVPLALVAVAGLAEVAVAGFGSRGGWFLLLGALGTGAAMLAFGLRNVQLAFGRPPRKWMRMAVLGSVIPPVFSLYVLAWRGLREVALGEGTAIRLLGVILTALGLWALRSWMKVVDVQKLAKAMDLSMGTDQGQTS